MASTSRWADTAEDAAAERRRKQEKEERKRAKQLKAQQEQEARAAAAHAAAQAEASKDRDPDRPSKRRRLSNDADPEAAPSRTLLRFETTGWAPSRRIDHFETLNPIEEGSYGWVSRARERATGTVVALKKLKMGGGGGGGPTDEGFPVAALREIQILQRCRHPHVVELREVVAGAGPGEVYMVLGFLEHDLKSLLADLPAPFAPSETKALLRQLCAAVAYLHARWILHRDIKTSNILLDNRGRLRLADFGMARYTASPPPAHLTRLVVTLWYRSPELLLGASTYGPAVDLWSVGCVFAELLTCDPFLPGRDEADQLAKTFAAVGVPTAASWPGFRRLPHARALALPSHPPPPPSLGARFPQLTAAGAGLLGSLLALDPEARPEADAVLTHEYFREDPRPKSEGMFPTFPSRAGLERRRRVASPTAPRGREARGGEGEFGSIFGAG